jgi:hypothetical protein
MANYYVDSNAAGTASGADWTNAYLTLKAATDVATSSDTIYIASNHAEVNGAAVTITLPSSAGLRIISADKTSGTPPTTAAVGASVSMGTAGAALTIAGFGYLYGITFLGGSGSSNTQDIFITGNTSPAYFVFEECLIANRSTNATAYLQLGAAGSSSNDDSLIELINCALSFAGSSNTISVGNTRLRATGLSIDSGSATPTSLFTTLASAYPTVEVTASDLSGKSWTNLHTLVASQGAARYSFSECKLPSGFVAMSGSGVGAGGPELWLHDCSSGDTHGLFQYHNPLGSVVSDTATYLTAGAAAQSWKVTTTSAVSWQNPFITPWIDWYNTGTSSVTPRIEVLRNNGSAASYDNDEIYGEFTVKTDAGFTNSTVYGDGISTPLTTPASQAAGVGTGSWTIGSSSSPYSLKCDSGAAVTPDEVGAIRGRVVVAVPSIAGTIFIDPQIRT